MEDSVIDRLKYFSKDLILRETLVVSVLCSFALKTIKWLLLFSGKLCNMYLTCEDGFSANMKTHCVISIIEREQLRSLKIASAVTTLLCADGG